MKRLVFCTVCVTLLTASLGAENVNVVTPKAGLSINEQAGTFSVYLISANGQRVPIFEESSAMTGFYLTADKKTYPLRGGAGVTTKASNIQDGGAIAYAINKLAEVTVEFAFASSLAGRPADMLRVDVRILNKSGKQKIFEIKGLFDTILGESDASFFSTAVQRKISAEYVIDDIAPHQWVRGTDNGNSMYFLLYGDGITSPKSVALANTNIMSASGENAEYSPGRNFSTGNVAADIRWDPIQLQKNQSVSITFYLFLGNGEAPSLAQLSALNRGRPASQIAPIGLTEEREANGIGAYVYPPIPTYDAPSYPPTTYPQNMYPENAYPPVYQYPSAAAAYPPAYQNLVPPVHQEPAVVIKPDVDLAYALDLYDRIQKLASGPVTKAARAEIARLNSELDEFFARKPIYTAQPVYTLEQIYQSGTPDIDLGYALDLYDRIQKLSSEKGGLSGKNREEIIRLNSELTVFLARIGLKK